MSGQAPEQHASGWRDLMADLAIAFHWRLEDMRAMTPAELLDWHRRARKRMGTG